MILDMTLTFPCEAHFLEGGNIFMICGKSKCNGFLEIKFTMCKVDQSAKICFVTVA